MDRNCDILLKAINNKEIVKVSFNSKEKGLITRRCIPFDFGPSKRYKDGEDRFHFHDLDSPNGNHTLSILPDKINSIALTGENFEPKDYVTWKPNWIVSRDWGDFS